eukprot:TRINITY_DN12981_c0_g2_i1.p1 TRINITY_DN12981_c0_g2~~TRINITY_DN12981_c0_g2_i1.p1  ORF type:complete len:718 (+),score=105.93 TRINITY_DN12981_c0_g2_i1:78-2231(+)
MLYGRAEDSAESPGFESASAEYNLSAEGDEQGPKSRCQRLSDSIKGSFRSPPVQWSMEKNSRFSQACHIAFVVYGLDCLRNYAMTQDTYVSNTMGLSLVASTLLSSICGQLLVRNIRNPQLKEVTEVISALILYASVCLEGQCRTDVIGRQRVFHSFRAVFRFFPALVHWRIQPSMVWGFCGIAGDAVFTYVGNHLHDEDAPVGTTVLFAVVLMGCYLPFSWSDLRQFDAEEELRFEKESFQNLLTMLCDSVAYVGPDKDTIQLCDDHLCGIIGKDMKNETLGSCLPQEEKQRVFQAFTAASNAPAMLPSSFSVEGEHVQVDLCIVRRAIPNDVHRQSGFLVGMKIQQERLPLSCAAPMAGPDDVKSCEPDEESMSLISVDHMSLSTERVLDGSDITKLGMQQVISLGIREHWLIRDSDLKQEDLEPLGSGGCGTVMKATFYGATVALKTMKTESARGRQTQLQELRMLRHVRHPNIVTFYGACVQLESLEVKLVFEHIDLGITLRTLVDHSKDEPEILPLGARANLTLHVCRAVLFIHNMDPPIIHRDIKPSNVLVQFGWKRAMCGKLSDFGLSDQLSTRVGVGTTQYSAPEVFCGFTAELATKVDVFSFGRLIYFVATSKKPAGKYGRKEIINMAKAGQMPELEWPEVLLLPGVRSISERCQSFFPAERPDIGEVYCTLQELLDRDENLAECTVPASAIDLEILSSQHVPGQTVD